MLVLKRKQGESLVIGDEIEITLLQCSRRRCSVGITAPREIAIRRKELINEEPEKKGKRRGKPV